MQQFQDLDEEMLDLEHYKMYACANMRLKQVI
jgi:hypothetical protein